MMSGRPRLAVLGSREWYCADARSFAGEAGRALARQFARLELVTNAMDAVQREVAEAFVEEAMVLGRANPDELSVCLITPSDVPGAVAGKLLAAGSYVVVRVVAGSTHAEARRALADAADACLLISGGPGSAAIAEHVHGNGRPVLCVPATGGAAAGSFWLPASLRQMPSWLSVHPSGIEVWRTLSGPFRSKNEVVAAAEAAAKALQQALQFSAKL
ncbi:unnamed protein product [Polarella glacialis]|uniref:Uncharacterized protein n=1 Tax=Polarella glacialis TaxID=89957 RepID=A0A813GNW9_POLGL|nr:unnamed protein product [Polarella glacialis]